MATKKGYSRMDFFGDTIHYDAHGKKIGETRPSFFGGATHYDAKGRKIGTSSPNLFGGETIYDANNKKLGSTAPGLFGNTYYDASHRKVGSSLPLWGHSTNDNDLSNRYENLYDDAYRKRMLSQYQPSASDKPEPYINLNSNLPENSGKWDKTAVWLALLIVGAFVVKLLVRGLGG